METGAVILETPTVDQNLAKKGLQSGVLYGSIAGVASYYVFSKSLKSAAIVGIAAVVLIYLAITKIKIN